MKISYGSMDFSENRDILDIHFRAASYKTAINNGQFFCPVGSRVHTRGASFDPPTTVE